jgi:hypothetical protein
MELELEGNRLNEHQFLTDLDDVKKKSGCVYYHSTVTGVLNTLPSFAGLNPSIEEFSYFVSGTLPPYAVQYFCYTVRLLGR